ncbi:MAG: hypothetical protein DWC09_06050 [Candidatus Poseidoniales archaeon]|nr:MAG: hypothetical protein DWC09_06050 [Candidatus Poseidoniales archaeon]
MTYIPTSRDLNWTMKTIHSLSLWAMPSGASVIVFDHPKRSFKAYVAGLASEEHLQNFTKSYTNLLCLGYTENQRVICEDVGNSQQILEDFFKFSSDELERALVKGKLNAVNDPRFEES